MISPCSYTYDEPPVEELPLEPDGSFPQPKRRAPRQVADDPLPPEAVPTPPKPALRAISQPPVIPKVLLPSDRLRPAADDAARQLIRSLCDYGPQKGNEFDPSTLPGIHADIARRVLDAIAQGAEGFAGIYPYFTAAPEGLRIEFIECNEGYSPRPDHCAPLLEIIAKHHRAFCMDVLADRLRVVLERGDNPGKILREIAKLEEEARLPRLEEETEVEPINETFPMDCLPGAAGVMAMEIAKVTTAQSEQLAAASVLSVLSASIGAGIEVSTGGERSSRGNIFLFAVAESGTGKGENMSLAEAPLAELEAQEIEAFEAHTRPRLLAELQVADARSKVLCKQASKESDRHARHAAMNEYKEASEEVAAIQRKLEAAPRWKVGDATQEALAIAMRGQPGEALTSSSSEARNILNVVKGRYGKEGGDEGLYCSAYSGDSVTIDRVGRSRVTLRRPCLSVCWMVQPDAARKMLGDDSMVESGLMPRFLIFDAKAEPRERDAPPPPIPHGVKSAWAALVADLARNFRQNEGESFKVEVAPAAMNLLADFERECIRRRRSSGDLRDLASFVARWAENAWRLALVIHAARHGGNAHSHPLSEETASDAIRVMRWFAAKQLEILAGSRRARLEKRLSTLSALFAAANAEISISKLRRSHGFEQDEIEQLAREFPKKIRVIKRSPDDGIGRPSIVVRMTLEDMNK